MSREREHVELTFANRSPVGLERRLAARRYGATEDVDDVDTDLTGRAGHHHARRRTHVDSPSWVRTCTTSPTEMGTGSPLTSTTSCPYSLTASARPMIASCERSTRTTLTQGHECTPILLAQRHLSLDAVEEGTA